MSRPSSVSVTMYVRHLLDEIVDADPSHGVKSRLARELGLSPQALGQIMLGQRNVGRDLEDIFAAKFTKGSVDRLREDADAWWAEQPQKGESRRVEYDERYPNRAKAVEAARALGLAVRAIEIVQGFSLASATDPEPIEWLDMIRDEDRKLKRGIVEHRQPVLEGEVGGAPVIPKVPKKG